jgi:ABC-type antimicrobial peptide transport system permease subunit
VVINEAMARRFWKDADPLKDRIVINWDGWAGPPKPRQIVGIVADVRQSGLHNTPQPQIYVPYAQLTDSANAFVARLAPTTWVVRTVAESHQMTTAIQEQLQQATKLPVYAPHSMDEIVSLSLQEERGLMVVITAVAALALLLSVVGIYGVMAYSVQQRTQEIGVRLALGATPGQVRNMVVRHGSVLTAAGVVIGITSAWELAHLMESMLFGVQPRDPVVFVTVPVVLSSVALLAVLLPAIRASRVQPMDALRHE